MTGAIKIIEAELKARLRNGQINHIEKLLKSTYKCIAAACVYDDSYFDTSTLELKQSERELRLRKIISDDGEQILLTYKAPPLGRIGKSKLEHEIQVSSFEQAADILMGLGYIEDISFAKYCTNMRLTYRSAEILVTLVTIAELKQEFIEAEVLIREAGDLGQVHKLLSDFLSSLQVEPDQLTNEYYTDMVRHCRDL